MTVPDNPGSLQEKRKRRALASRKRMAARGLITHREREKRKKATT